MVVKALPLAEKASRPAAGALVMRYCTCCAVLSGSQACSIVAVRRVTLPSWMTVSGSFAAGPPARLGARPVVTGSARVGRAATSGASLTLVIASATVATALSLPQRSRATTWKLSLRVSRPSCT